MIRWVVESTLLLSPILLSSPRASSNSTPVFQRFILNPEWFGVCADDQQNMTQLYNALLPHLVSRQHQIMSEFSFWPSSPPRDSGFTDGGIFEMRSYQLQPGKLLEWEGAWRRGLEARRRFVVSASSRSCLAGAAVWRWVVRSLAGPRREYRKSTRCFTR